MTRPLLPATLAAFALGAGGLLVAEATVLRVAAMLVLLSAIAGGVFLIADPAELSREDDQPR